MIRSFFSTLSTFIWIYSLLCIARIFLSWAPQLLYSQVGTFLSTICDPYLDWFRRFKFMRAGMVDFSPIVSIGLLTVLSQAASSIAITGSFSVLQIIIQIILLIWSFFRFFLNLLSILLIIRLIYHFMHTKTYSQFWIMLDKFLAPVITKITRITYALKIHLSYCGSLILSIIVILTIRFLLGAFIGSLITSLMIGAFHFSIL
ncbi:YggT family protein [Treponema phagedenis]|uniref:YGGT family protein n=1 Tax=Treponema phagedenis TaxID=162 RepID=A0A0B7GP84_TREPH|nr:YggT family protein [Treponema phagedenis]NVP24418.1 YggT family protein [Treponema phagedenis]NVP25343.1 YggT family protein [Treponema phagedenis]QEJ95439.1 YggT family protein [Treponema phagedenis]QEJ97820.1 YggT family protein [Treponema phagedenis]QEK01293.1 YggT family protein [Treponema phagedenis]